MPLHSIVSRNLWTLTASALALFLLAETHAWPQQKTATPVLSGIAHVAIRVSDLAASRKFYESMGFEEAFAMSTDGTPTESFLKINDRQFIELYPRRQPSDRVGFMHVCFESADLEILNHDYLDRGLHPNPVKRAGAGNLLFTMEGPERQNIEYTQYMAGSMHSNDRGKHLGANRISDRIAALGIGMQDPAAAQTFYETKLGFYAAGHPMEQGWPALRIPGESGEMVEFVQQEPVSTMRLIFSVRGLRRTAARLQALHLPFERGKDSLSMMDPDGNHIVFVKPGKRT